MKALAEHTPPRYELIVVDNGSPDGSGSRLADRAGGVRVVPNPTNLNFGPAVNLAASHARANYLLLLDRDCIVRPGWLDPLQHALEADERNGAVGPCHVRMDGSIHSAGGLVDRTGDTAPAGRGSPPGSPAHRFPVAVDYLSSTCLLLRRRAVAEVGGLDPGQGAHYRDIDLGFALQAHGYRCIYQPLSSVTYIEGRTPAEPRAAVAERERSSFTTRWQDELAFRPAALGRYDTTRSSPRGTPVLRTAWL